MCFCYICILILFPVIHVIGKQPWDLPLFPLVVDESQAFQDGVTSQSSNYTKMIPRNLWIAVTDSDDELSYQMKPLFERNKEWNVFIIGNKEKDMFMKDKFRGTSLLWAYEMIHPSYGAAKADIWRYAVLWMYGGVYLDDDSDIKAPLDDVIDPMDSIIITFEKNNFNGDTCYITQHHLSDLSTFSKSNAFDDQQIQKKAFHGRTLPNWAIFSAPRHRIISRTIENVVELFKADFLMEPVVRHMKGDFRWNLIMCSTGPSMFTASARETIFLHPNTSYKLANTDFKDYGGKFKAVSTRPRDNPSHYMNMHNNDKVRNTKGILSYYEIEKPLSNVDLKHLEGKAVQGHNGKQIYVIENGMKRGIPSFETFMALNYTMTKVIVLTDFKLSQIIIGKEMPVLKYQWPD